MTSLRRWCGLRIRRRRIRRLRARQTRQSLVQRRVDEARVRVAVHQRVDLQLRLVERVRRRLHHVAVDDLADARVQRHLQASGR